VIAGFIMALMTENQPASGEGAASGPPQPHPGIIRVGEVAGTHVVGDSNSITESVVPEVVAAVAPIVTAAATVARAHIKQQGLTARAQIAADVEHERIRSGLPPTPDAATAPNADGS